MTCVSSVAIFYLGAVSLLFAVLGLLLMLPFGGGASWLCGAVFFCVGVIGSIVYVVLLVTVPPVGDGARPVDPEKG